MLDKVQGLMGGMIGRVLNRTASSVTGYDELLDDIEEARREFRVAVMKLENATDPDVIPHLAYEVKTKERRYIHIHNKIKEKGLTLADDVFYSRIIC